MEERDGDRGTREFHSESRYVDLPCISSDARIHFRELKIRPVNGHPRTFIPGVRRKLWAAHPARDVCTGMINYAPLRDSGARPRGSRGEFYKGHRMYNLV